ncbi:hypothetical protein GY45DRAFT_71010 [Cubamyces sp. BRFM 1775]|nr:hypothetical protein GY45DRAFT_71010 [Cubamyces sp. BRFM 1775]
MSPHLDFRPGRRPRPRLRRVRSTRALRSWLAPPKPLPYSLRGCLQATTSSNLSSNLSFISPALAAERRPPPSTGYFVHNAHPPPSNPILATARIVALDPTLIQVASKFTCTSKRRSVIRAPSSAFHRGGRTPYTTGRPCAFFQPCSRSAPHHAFIT